VTEDLITYPTLQRCGIEDQSEFNCRTSKKKGEKLLGRLNDYQLLKKGGTLCSYYAYSLPFFSTIRNTMTYELIRAFKVNYIYTPYSVILLLLVSSLDAVSRYVYI
jgi:hypothetical protein